MIKNINKYFNKDGFYQVYKDIAVLASGSIISQCVLLIATPILTRLYTPDQFGVLAIYMSLLFMLGVGTTGKYELAIVIPEKEKESVALTRITLLLNFLGVVAIFILIWLLRPFFIEYFKLSGEALWLFLIPLSILINASINSIQQWNLRKREYKINSSWLVFNAALISVVNIALGTLGFFKQPLIIAYIIAQIAGLSFFLFFLIKKDYFKKLVIPFKKDYLKKVLKKYSSFPKFQLGSEILLTVSQQITPMIFAYFYTTTVVGHYVLAVRIVKAPLLVIAGSIGNVFKNSAIDEFKEKGNCEELFFSLFKKLFLLSIIPFLIIIFAAPQIFTILLGDGWNISGQYAQLLSLSLFFELLVIPFYTIFQITNAQKIFLLLQTINVIFVTVSIGLGYWLYGTAWHSILCFVIANIIFQCITLSIIIRLTKKNIYNQETSALS